ncbi:CRISPR-associated helicase Cas3' [Methylocaldum sp.]|uniref:type I-G CRISPR-associated helicase/endonuclease Cas3g n=1 Tax=Methylocaldum sp. TaxID=1969727 RepID=UPI0032207B5F
MTFDDFFKQATGLKEPYDYQRRLAEGPWPDLLDVPTGMGKTAAVTLAWAWKRRVMNDSETPRRLVWCLPMRVLVGQTHDNIVRWLDQLGMLAGSVEWNDRNDGLKSYEPQPDSKSLPSDGWASQEKLSGAPIAVHLLMGGAEHTDWVTWPECDAILIGTQDMLLSRALNRGYAAGRARWPMDFGLLNNDCLWVFDEIQLMDTSLATSLQLDAWRKALRLRGTSGFPEETENPVARPCRSLWMSATMARHWLDSAVDWQPCAQNAWDHRRYCLTDKDDQQVNIKKLFSNTKSVAEKQPVARLLVRRGEKSKPDISSYLDSLVSAIVKHKVSDGLTLVIVNTVERATLLYERISTQSNGVDIHLIHSRFRPMEREQWKKLFASDNQKPRVIVSTQVVEAGVDISAKVLFTELAPWASLVQRFGRCARRAGENGVIYWMDTSAHESTALPYTENELTEAKRQLEKLTDVALKPLKELKADLDQPKNAGTAHKLFPYNPRFVPRDKDLFDLFDTTPDLTGADVDIRRYIRDGEELDVQVFWRDIGGEPDRHVKPDRRELCPVAFYRFREALPGLLKHGRVWRRNYRKGWEPVHADQSELIYPGQVFLIETSCGGYDTTRGWTGDPNDRNFELLPVEPGEKNFTSALDENNNSEDGEPLSELPGWVKLSEHLWHVCKQMDRVGKELLPEADLKLSKLAARWHDRGKAHECFEANFKPDVLDQAKAGQLEGEPAAKAPDGKSSKGKERDDNKDAWRRDKPKPGDQTDKRRPGFRHELASALAIMETLRQARPDHPAFAWPEGLNKKDFGEEAETEGCAKESGPAAEELAKLSGDDFDLLLYLVAAHHGKVRMSLRSSSDDGSTDVPDPCPAERRQARGVRDCDRLPASKMPDSNGNKIEATEVFLNLDPMELGLSLRYGPSWRERMQGLLERLGPFRLAYLETLQRVADWRASRREQLEAEQPTADNSKYELDRRHTPLAQPPAGGTAPDSSRPPAAQGGAEHGIRGGTGGSADAGTGTRPPHAATRHLTTTLGVLSYAELAPYLASRVEALQKAIEDGELDGHALTENLFLDLHRRICGDLTPDFAGRWRDKDVVVGDHEPPPHFKVAQHMCEYVRDLQARLESLPPEPDDHWLEALAFAEGRLLSIHPFADFNGRVTRVFIDLLTRRLTLPDVDPTPDPGEATERYLRALRAADKNNWRPLMDTWRERFEQGGEI